MEQRKARVAVLVSGSGTNLQAIIDAAENGAIPHGEIRLVISNKAGAYALKRAEAAGIPAVTVLKKECGGQEGFEKELIRILTEYGIELISMIAPTSNERIEKIARDAEGFLYIVSSLGVTGVRSAITTDIPSMVSLVRSCTDIPCAVGFGISTPEQASRMASFSDGAIVGSAIVRIIAEHGTSAVEPVREYVRAMAEAVHSTK